MSEVEQGGRKQPPRLEPPSVAVDHETFDVLAVPPSQRGHDRQHRDTRGDRVA